MLAQLSNGIMINLNDISHISVINIVDDEYCVFQIFLRSSETEFFIMKHETEAAAEQERLELLRLSWQKRG
jgi:hypothetical protein